MALSLVPSIESRLITTKALTYMDSKVPGRTQSFYTIRFTGTGSNHNSIQTQAGTVRLWDATTGRLLGGWAGTTENFVRIGHSLLALLVGWFGGLLSRRLWQVSRSARESAAVNTEVTTP